MATLGTHAFAPHLDRDLPYDPLRHFSPVSLVASAPLVLACHPSLGVASARELIELARTQPGSLTYGTSAIGGAPHLAAALFESAAGIEMQHVRYDHTERLYDDLEAGRISLSFNNMMSMLPRCRSGALRALAVTSARRSEACEDLPTLAESGLPGYEVSNWVGIVAPKSTPEGRVQELSRAIAAALKESTLAEAFRATGVTPRGSTSSEFTDFIATELRRWAPVVARFRETSVAPVSPAAHGT